jgi:hypothetical protein
LDRAGYAEAELVDNRAAVLLSGGSAADRQAWAEEAATRLGSAVTLVDAPEALPAALAQKNGVVLVVDAVSLGEAAQQALVRCLQTQEERPKLIIAVQDGAAVALGTGSLRPDLHYRLRLAQVDLDELGLRESIARRRARPPPSRSPLPPRTPSRPAARSVSRAKKAAKPRPKKAKKPRKQRSTSRKRSRR